MIQTPPVGISTAVEITPGDLTILNGGTPFAAPGTTQAFVFQPSKTSKAAHTLLIYALLTGAPATVTVTIQVADDAGNWTTLAVNIGGAVQAYSGIAFATNNAQTFAGLVPGFRYRINLTTLSGGTCLFKVGVT